MLSSEDSYQIIMQVLPTEDSYQINKLVPKINCILLITVIMIANVFEIYNNFSGVNLRLLQTFTGDLYGRIFLWEHYKAPLGLSRLALGELYEIHFHGSVEFCRRVRNLFCIHRELPNVDNVGH